MGGLFTLVPAALGCLRLHSYWTGFMDGKGAIRIGAGQPFAMIETIGPIRVGEGGTKGDKNRPYSTNAQLPGAHTRGDQNHCGGFWFFGGLGSFGAGPLGDQAALCGGADTYIVRHGGRGIAGHGTLRGTSLGFPIDR